MPSKKVVQDIIPSSRRSIKLVPLKKTEREEIPGNAEEVKKTRASSKPKTREIVEEEVFSDNFNPKRQIPFEAKKQSTKHKGGLFRVLFFLTILLAVGIIGFAISLIYSKAIVTITPEKIELNVNGNFLAKKDAVSEDSLGYQLITISEQVTTTVPAVDGPLIQTKAKGIVTLYNSFSTSSQKIVAGTRLSSNNGLIYKTTTSVVIPGKKIVSGKLVYGSVVAPVIAEQFGQNFNSKITDLNGDFRFVGYKGTPKYEGFFGRLKTDLTGGYNGTKKIVQTDIQAKTLDSIKKSIESKLISRANSAVPEGYTIFDKSYYIDYVQLTASTSPKGQAEISIKGTIYGIIFNSKSLLNFIANKQIQDSLLVDYKIDGLKKMSFKIINDKDFSPQKGNTLSFNLSGKITITGVINEEELKAKLLGVKVKKMDNVIKSNPSVKYASVLLTPFWMRSFPTSAENIIFTYK